MPQMYRCIIWSSAKMPKQEKRSQMSTKNPDRKIMMDLEVPESKLILRLRQLRHDNEHGIVTISMFPLALQLNGKYEYLDVNNASGSMIVW